MEIFSHILWTLIIWPQNNYPYLPLLIAAIPDFLPFLASFFYFSYKKKASNFLAKGLGKKVLARFFSNHFAKGVVTEYPKSIKIIYHSLHSIIVFVLIFIILLIIFGLNNVITYFICLPWIFHILIDIFAHGKKYKGPEFLFPISKFKFKGLSYYSLHIIIINYLLLAILLIIKFGG
jgi:hypothetical protein